VNCDGKLAAFGIPNTKRKIFWSLGFDDMMTDPFEHDEIIASGLRFWGMFLSLLAILKKLEMTCSIKI